MRPSDPRLRRQLAVARPQLTAAVAGSVLTALLIIAQAWVVTSLVLAALHDGNVTRWGALTVLVFAARGAVGWVVDSRLRDCGRRRRHRYPTSRGAVAAQPTHTGGDR